MAGCVDEVDFYGFFDEGFDDFYDFFDGFYDFFDDVYDFFGGDFDDVFGEDLLGASKQTGPADFGKKLCPKVCRRKVLNGIALL